jgi:hypothetical protein
VRNRKEKKLKILRLDIQVIEKELSQNLGEIKDVEVSLKP